MKKKYLIIMFALLILLGVIVFQKSFAIDFTNSNTSSLQIEYGAYENLPKNHVHISSLGFRNNDVEFTTTDSSHFKFIGNEDGSLEDPTVAPRSSTYKRVFWYGNITNFGENFPTSSMANMNVNGSFSLRFKNAASLSDGTVADVKLTISDINYKIGKNVNNLTGPFYIPIVEGDENLWTNVSSPSRTRNLTASERTGAVCNAKMKVKLEVLKSNTDTPIDSKFEQMLFGMYDFDAYDASIAVSSADDKGPRYNGTYSEGVEFLSGIASPIVLGPRENSSNIFMKSSLKATNVNNNIKLNGDGNIYQARYNAVGTTNDDSTYYSGFVAPVNPQGFSFNWYGSSASYSIGSPLYGFPNVNVTATSSDGGTIEKQGTKSYNLNSSTTYDYTPSKGYKVKSLKVNGSDVDFSPYGGTYTFNKLYKNPLVQVDSTTGKAGESLGNDYTIDVQFEESERIKVKYVTDNYGSISINSENVIEGDSPVGFTDSPNSGYKLLMIKCDKPVQLESGKIILKDKPMTLNELKKVIVDEPLVCTVYHKIDNSKNYNCD